MVVPALRLYEPPPEVCLAAPPVDYVVAPSRLTQELLEGKSTLEALSARLTREFQPENPMLPGLRTEITELWVWHLHRMGWAYLVCQVLASEQEDTKAHKVADICRQMCHHLKTQIVRVLEAELPGGRLLGSFGTDLGRVPTRMGDFFGIPAEQYRLHALPNLRKVVHHSAVLLDLADPFECLELSWATGWGSVPETNNPLCHVPVAPLNFARS
jgi:hypothetical protein